LNIIIRFSPFQIKSPLVLQAPTQNLQISIQIINISQVMNNAIPSNSGGYNKNTQHSIGPLVMRDTSRDIGDKNIGSSNLHAKMEDNISHFSNDHDQNRQTIELVTYNIYNFSSYFNRSNLHNSPITHIKSYGKLKSCEN
jgi:hypothetical protein